MPLKTARVSSSPKSSFLESQHGVIYMSDARPMPAVFYVIGKLKDVGDKVAVTANVAEAEDGRKFTPIFYSKQEAEAFIKYAALPVDPVELPGAFLLQHLQELIRNGVHYVSINPRLGAADLIGIFPLLVALECVGSAPHRCTGSAANARTTEAKNRF